MPTLWRYVSARFAAAFGGTFAILVLTVFVVDTLLHADELLGAKNDPSGVLVLLLLRGASRYLPYLLPVASFVAAFLVVGLAARAQEVLALKAAGIPPLRALLPVFAGAALISGAALVLSETLSVRAAAELNRRKGGDATAFYRLASESWYHTGRFIYDIRSPDAESEILEDVRVFERDERGRLLRLIEARRARRSTPGHWRFEQGAIRSFDPDRPDAPPAYEPFESTEQSLAEEHVGSSVQGDLASVPVWALGRYQPGPREARRIHSVLHQRLTNSLLAALFALLAVPLGLCVERTRSLTLPAAQGVAVLLVFLMAREYGSTLTAHTNLPAALMPWLTLALFAGFGFWQLARSAR